jgi:hypothetical protein
MITIQHIEVIKSKIEAMPEDERALFMLLGHAENQINLLYKLLILLTNKDPKNELEATLSAAQSQILARILIGVITETWELIRTRFIGSPMAKKYVPKLDDEGKQALEDLKKSFGKSGLLHQLRNEYIFHYPSTEIMEKAFQKVTKDKHLDTQWNWFFSESAFNSFFFINDIVFMYGMLSTTIEVDVMLSYQKINEEVNRVANNMVTFLKALMVLFWKEHIGMDMSSKSVTHINDAPNLSNMYIPFFFEV